MTWVISADGTTVDSLQNKPKAWPRLDGTGTVFLNDATETSLFNDCGWYELDVSPARPADTPTETYRSTVVNLSPGAFQRQWVHDPDVHASRLANEDREAKRLGLLAAVATLRSWADDAAATTVTAGNHEAVTQTLVDRLGTFFGHFADLIESRL